MPFGSVRAYEQKTENEKNSMLAIDTNQAGKSLQISLTFPPTAPTAGGMKRYFSTQHAFRRILSLLEVPDLPKRALHRFPPVPNGKNSVKVVENNTFERIFRIIPPPNGILFASFCSTYLARRHNSKNPRPDGKNNTPFQSNRRAFPCRFCQNGRHKIFFSLNQNVLTPSKAGFDLSIRL